ncbi:TPA: hypothetical protein U9D51_000157 [Streptococcus agalactiae]|nr:hypothetical protein [Streptococcus agalactiae]
MVDDVLPKLLKSVQQDFEKHFGKSEVVAKAFAELQAKKATYKTVNEFAVEVGRLLSLALANSVISDELPDGKMYYNIANRLVNDTLRHNYKLISDYAGDVQQNLNKQAKISLKIQRPPLNQDKIDGLVNRLASEPVFDDVKWLLDEPIVNFSQSIVDDCIRANADFHFKTGLKPTIERISTGKCCDWCDRLAGRYVYHEEPKDFYKRHQHCQCVIDYHPKNGKRQNSWSKKWTKETTDILERRKQMNIDIRDNNRKSDIKEYKEIVSILGTKAPISLAKFQDLKYNDGIRYERLKDQAHIQGNFKNGSWLDKVNPEKQARYIKSTAGEGKSYFFDDVDTDVLYQKYKQTGELIKNRRGRTHKELIDLPEDISIGIDIYSGNLVNGLTIHYGKTGSHIVPTYHERRE